MSTYTTNSPTSLEEQRIARVLEIITAWKSRCICDGDTTKFCESFGCSSLDELAAVLRGETWGETL